MSERLRLNSFQVGADGVSSKVRGAMGAQYLTWNYGQMGLVATVRLSEKLSGKPFRKAHLQCTRPRSNPNLSFGNLVQNKSSALDNVITKPTENKVAWQRFLPTGPVALLPLTDELSSLVWSINSDEARRLLNLTDECFVDALNEALWKQHPRHPAVDTATRRLDSILDSLMLRSSAVRQLQPSVAEIEPDSRAAFPLAFGHSTRYMSAGVVLIGFVPIILCSHRVHPLAGQGVNLGFGDVKCLTELLAESVYSGQSIGSKSPLLNYETSRQRHNVPTMLAIDGLQKLYSTEATPIVILRSLGLQLTHALTPLKSTIMNHAAV
uniref:(California timema) hypothetical protein n=1 Tax=Timema californicum TaxID=61474 RepID=A0A7R9J1J6_TIMCA|nr:unnamed protein product [Timema californicum]